MITSVVQRWRDRRGSYRPAGETINLRDYDVASINGDASAKAFVVAHHYARSYPAARRRFGFYHRTRGLVGVAVFSVPQNPATLAPYPGDVDSKIELGRFVLLDDVEGNGETRFLRLCFDELRREGFVSVVSFSDPVARTAVGGDVIFPGHIGGIYQAFNAHYFGRTKPEHRRLLPDGTVLGNRTLAKLRARDQGWQYAAEILMLHGAPAPRGDLRLWAEKWAQRLTRPLWHDGQHRYAWILDRRVACLVPSKPYPKFDLEPARRCA